MADEAHELGAAARRLRRDGGVLVSVLEEPPQRGGLLADLGRAAARRAACWGSAAAAAVIAPARAGGRPARPDALAPAQLGDEPVAVAAVDRADELDDRPLLGAGRALELERRRVQRHAEDLGLLLVRHRRLDRLDAADDLDPVAVGEQVVERRLVEVLARQPGNEPLRDMERLDRHRLVVREPQPLRDDDPLRRRDVEAAAEVRAGVLELERERLAAGPHPAAAHLLAERRHRQLLRDLRLAHERAAAAPAHEIALARELVDRRADGQPRDAEILAQLPLGGNRVPRRRALDQVEDLVARLALLGDPLRGRGHRGPHPNRVRIKWSIPIHCVAARAGITLRDHDGPEPVTEHREARHADIDLRSTLELVELINDEDARVAPAVGAPLPQLAGRDRRDRRAARSAAAV